MLSAFVFSPFCHSQTTQPAGDTQDSQFVDGVTALSLLLTSADDAGDDRLTALLPDGVPIRQFDSKSETQTRYHLKRLLQGMTPLSLHCYEWPTTHIASDIARDVTENQSAPAEIRRQFMLSETANVDRINSAAHLWASNALQPAPGDSVAVALFWQSAPVPSDFSSVVAQTPREPVFVLLRGRVEAGGCLKITQVRFGQPFQALN